MLEIRGNMGQCKSEGKDFKSNYSKAKLRANMGHSESRKET
jgi:hypothetical protein